MRQHKIEKAKCIYIGDVENNEVRIHSDAIAKKGFVPKPELLIGECLCGYHFGVDATYLVRCGDFKFRCPSCDQIIDTAVVFSEWK